MPGRLALLQLLADGGFHNGGSLARGSGLARAALDREIDRLSAWGLEVQARPGHGYRLAYPIDLLDEARIRAGFSPATAARVRRLVVEHEIDSTNTALLAVTDLPPARNDVMLAEFQSAGRGRCAQRPCRRRPRPGRRSRRNRARNRRRRHPVCRARLRHDPGNGRRRDA